MISSFDPGTEFLTPERCYIVEIHNCAHDPACSIARARARVAPGVTFLCVCTPRFNSANYINLERPGG